MKIAMSAAFLMAAAAPTQALAQGFDWQLIELRLGVAYASGVSDITDLYEDNLRLEGFDADVDLKLPLGIAAGVRYDWASGMRGDLGLGPMFFIGGDVDHFELPLTATVGYNFLRDGQYSPYVRAGLTHHFVSGDYYSSSNPGVFVAAGLDFTHFSIEVAVDRSEVEFDTFSCNAVGLACQPAVTQFSTYDVIASFFWRFQ